MTVGDVLNHKHGSEPPKKRWLSFKPVRCQLCYEPLKDAFIDGYTIHGYWAILCVACHKIFGAGLGTGRGQKYSLDTLEKVEG